MTSVGTWLVLLGVIITFATAVVGFITTTRKVQEVHVLVNSQLHTVLTRVVQLTEALNAADVEVPETPEPPAKPPALETTS